jgi:hypothetical protein
MYVMIPYTAPTDNEISNSISQMAKNDEIGRAVVSGMKADRKGMFGGQLLRTLAYAALVLGCLYLYLKNIVKPLVIASALLLIAAIDLLVIDNDYLNQDHYAPADEISSQNFTSTAVEKRILQDRDPDFRVFDANVNPVYDRRSPYFFKSVTGYNPARLSIYQNLIDRYISGSANQNILNMMNAKYILYKNSQTNSDTFEINPYAYGPCWLVKNIRIVEGPAEEIQAIGSTNLRDTAIVQKTFTSAVTQPQWDSVATIKLTRFDNDTMDYSFRSAKPQFAVFSEVYYPYGWNAYIDGKKTEYCKTDYVLRGLSLPPGQHAVRFIFEPSSYKTGVKISYIASFLILIILLGGLFMEWRTSRGAKAMTS